MSQTIHQQEDHIILPKATLKRFMDKDTNLIAYLDMNDRANISVKKARPKTFHASPNYYNPLYDKLVKRQESIMGVLHKKIKNALASGTSVELDSAELKKNIIRFVNIEFCRSVIANDSMLDKYRKRQQEENDKVDRMLLDLGLLTMERINYSVNFRNHAQSLETFRRYAQNILATQNPAIIESSKNLIPRILYVPQERDDYFLLPPMHYVSSNNFIYFFLSPDIALGLYPPEENIPVMVPADRERVWNINTRVLESCALLDPGYQEVIGNKDQLDRLRVRIEKIKEIFTLSGKILAIDENANYLVNDMCEIFELVISLYLLFGSDKKMLRAEMKVHNFDRELIAKQRAEIDELFNRFSLELVI